MIRIAFNSLQKRSSLFSNIRKFTTKNNEVLTLDAEQFFKIISDTDLRKKYQIIDVREPNELELSSIPDKNVINLPLSQSGTWAQEIVLGNDKTLDSDLPSICVCHHGMRSLKVANFLGNSISS